LDELSLSHPLKPALITDHVRDRPRSYRLIHNRPVQSRATHKWLLITHEWFQLKERLFVSLKINGSTACATGDLFLQKIANCRFLPCCEATTDNYSAVTTLKEISIVEW